MPSKKTVFKTTMAVTLVIFISKALGFLREIIMTAYFGAGAHMDAYNMSYSIFYVPVLLFNSCITSTLVPAYVHLKEEGSKRELDRFTGNTLNLYTVLALGVTVIMLLVSAPLTRLLAGGFDAEFLDQTIYMLRIMLLSLCFSVGSIVLSTVLNARRNYLAAQLTGFPLTIALCVATIFFSAEYGIHALAWGVFFSGILQIVVLIPFFMKDFKYSFTLDFSDKRFRKMMLLAVPAILAMSVNELNHMIDKMLAATLPTGELSCMNLAFRLITFLEGVVLVPINTIAFSEMSTDVARDDYTKLRYKLKNKTGVIALIILPISIIGAIMAKDVIRLAYLHGAFTEKSVIPTATALLYYIIGVFSYGMRNLLSNAFHAFQDTRTPMLNAMFTVVLNIVLNVILVKVMGLGGLALATSVSATLGALSLAALLRKRMGSIYDKAFLIDFFKILVSALACGLMCAFLNRVLPQSTTYINAFPRLIIGTIVSGLVFLAFAAGLRVKQLSDVIAGIKRRLHR